MEHQEILQIFEHHDIKPTANRILIFRALAESVQPLSLKELEEKVYPIDKSGIFRTLTAFREHRMVHIIEGAENGVRYELCHHRSDEHDDDQHMHFYCERCKTTYCLETPVPEVELPDGFEVLSGNYMIKGICPKCAKE